MKPRKYWWVAATQDSAAMSPWPMSVRVCCIPTPEQLFGFESFEEARKVQHMMMTAPLETLTEFVNKCGKQLQEGTATFRYLRPANPEQPLAYTAWSDAPLDPTLN
jgi:hypothetical protein